MNASGSKRQRIGGAPRGDLVVEAAGTEAVGAAVVRDHPYGIRPWGSLYASAEAAPSIRSFSLGGLSRLTDATLLSIFGLLDPADLGRLCCVSKAVYVLAHEEALWKTHVLEVAGGDFSFAGTWYDTFAAIARPDGGRLAPHSPIAVDGFYNDDLYASFHCATASLDFLAEVENIERRAADEMSVDDFVREYDGPNKPVIITGLASTWAAAKWTPETLVARTEGTTFKTGGVEMSLRDYFAYARGVAFDETPMYLFDKMFGEKCPDLAAEYEVPPYFEEDFFALLDDVGTAHSTAVYDSDDSDEGGSRVVRPAFRWLLIGPPHSGSTFHQDPNGTSAWNGLISGAKKWVLYPKHVSPPGVFASDDGWDVTCPISATEWFLKFYPETRRADAYKPIECVLRPGEILFIPSQWWHTAINLEESIAVTQNFVSKANLNRVVSFLKTKPSSALYDAFCARLLAAHPDLHASACPPPSKVAAMFAPTDDDQGQFKFSFAP